MKVITATIKLEVPNSVAKRAEKYGLSIYRKNGKYRAKVEGYEVNTNKSAIDINVDTKNGKQGHENDEIS